MMVFGIALVVLGTGYAMLIGAFARGFRKVTHRPLLAETNGVPFVTGIVPARDESCCIKACLDSILANDYPAGRFEVMVVDDLSEDDTPDVVRRMIAQLGDEQDGKLQLLQMPENLERTRAHKKRAIEQGISVARGDIIMTTDADCLVPATWIRTSVAMFDDINDDPMVDAVTAFVSSPVLYKTGRGPLMHMQALEFLGLVAVGAGAIGAGRPTICNGANVAYRKDVFDWLGGFSGIDHLTSGDDELLMQKINDTTHHRVRFCASHAATVVTEPIHSFWEFFQQRKRWASKGAHYPNKRLIAMLVAIYLFYLGLLVGAFALPFVAGLWLPMLVAFGLKIVPEAALLWPACRHFGRRWLFAYFLPEQLLHVPYIVVLGAAGVFGKYEWQGGQVVR